MLYSKLTDLNVTLSKNTRTTSSVIVHHIFGCHGSTTITIKLFINQGYIRLFPQHLPKVGIIILILHLRKLSYKALKNFPNVK